MGRGEQGLAGKFTPYDHQFFGGLALAGISLFASWLMIFSGNESSMRLEHFWPPSEVLARFKEANGEAFGRRQIPAWFMVASAYWLPCLFAFVSLRGLTMMILQKVMRRDKN